MSYTVLTLNGRARHFLIDRCDECGALVHSRTTHDAWHALVAALLTEHDEQWRRQRKRMTDDLAG